MNADAKAEILLVDDEAQLRRLLRSTLEGAGYRVREAEDGRTALGEIALHAPDLVILDLGLPDTPGTDVLRALRPICSAPVLILSVIGREQMKIEALDAGADDYLSKPFDGGELLARLRALLRRSEPVAALEKIYRFGPVEADFERHRVLREGRTVKLTVTEFGLLRLMIMNRDKVLTHSHILREIWGPHATKHVNYLRIYMMRLRRKLGESMEGAGHFQTEAGVGYRFVSQPDQPW